MKRSTEGSIFRHDDGKRWIARLQYTDANRRRTQKKRICQTHEAAKRMLRELQDEIDNDNAGRKTYRELDRFYRDKYLHKAKIVDGKKLSGFRQKLSIIEHYLAVALDYFGDRYIDSITHGDLREFKDKVADTPLKEFNPDSPTRHHRRRSVADVNHHLRLVRRLLNVAIQNGWLAVNPFKLGDPLIIESHQVERTRILSADEEKILLAKCEPWRRHIKPIIIVAIETGMRRGELQSLR